MAAVACAAQAQAALARLVAVPRWAPPAGCALRQAGRSSASAAAPAAGRAAAPPRAGASVADAGSVARWRPHAVPCASRRCRATLLCGHALGTRRTFASSSGGKVEDPYKVLGVPRSASADDIKKAYRKQALEWHPDRHPAEKRQEAERKFSAAANAYEILSDPSKKREHDAGGMHGQPGAGGFPGGGFRPSGPGGVHSQESAEELFRQVFGSRGFEEVFQQFMGQQAGAVRLTVGMDVQVQSNAAVVLAACRESKIDSTNDAMRTRCLGKRGRIKKIDTSDQSVKVTVAGVGDVWFGSKAIRPTSTAKGGMPGFGGQFGAFGGFPGGSFPGAGPGVAQMKQQMVTRPDGTRVVRVTRSVRGPDGTVREETFETPLS